MKNIILAVICFLGVSCSSSESYFDGEIRMYDSFLMEGKLDSPDTLFLPESIIGISRISLIDSFMIIEKYGQNANLAIANLNNNETSENICLNGRGPNEYITFSNNEQYIKNSEKISLYTFDSNLSANLLNVTDSWQKDLTVIEEKKGISNISNSFCEGIFFLKDGSIFAKYKTSYNDLRDMIFLPAEYALFDDRGQKEVISFFGNSVVSNPNQPIISSFIYSGTSRIKPDGMQVVDGIFYMDYINFIDLKKKNAFGMKYRDALSYEEMNSITPEEYLKKMKVSYIDLLTTNDYIFGLYWGHNDTEPEDSFINMRIRIFDWNGTPLASLKPDRFIANIAFDERTNQLYALSTEEHIFIYDLNETLEKIRRAKN